VDVDLPPARSLTHLIVQTLTQLGGEAERHNIIDTAVNLGNFTDAQRAVPSRATRTKAKHASELHHRLSWAMSHARNAGEIEPVRQGVWRLTER
jgi:restriction endonuclease Mrr